MDKKFILMGIIVLCLSALVYISITGGSPTSPPPLPAHVSPDGLPAGHPPIGDEQGGMAPDFTLDSVNFGRVSLSQFRGKVVVINFWSTGCPPCIMEMPSLMKLKSLMAGKPFEVLTITSDPRSVSERFIERMSVTLPVLLDPDGRIAMTYGAYGLPTTFIIAADGTVDNHVVGAANWADGSVLDYMNKLIQSAPAAQKPSPPQGT
ncbi:MAG TPA: TlpA disulfide reductase family protein [bacterium]|nr:TlpA disulfide reductase family protein [bacterium]